MRYTVSKTFLATDPDAAGPLQRCVVLKTDRLAEAERYVFQCGGEVIDHQTRNGWAPGQGWYDVSDYLAQIEAP